MNDIDKTAAQFEQRLAEKGVIAIILTREQARNVLVAVRDNHDADAGVNWDALRHTARELFHVADND